MNTVAFPKYGRPSASCVKLSSPVIAAAIISCAYNSSSISCGARTSSFCTPHTHFNYLCASIRRDAIRWPGPKQTSSSCRARINRTLIKSNKINVFQRDLPAPRGGPPRSLASRWRTGRDSMAAVAVSGLAGNIDGCMNLYYGLASCLGPAPATKLVQNPRSGRWESSADACSVIRLMAAQHPMADLLAR